MQLRQEYCWGCYLEQLVLLLLPTKTKKTVFSKCRTRKLIGKIKWNIWNTVILGNNQNKNQDKLASNMVSTASQRNYRWIRVGDKMVALPQSVYNKVKVGDKITLVDNNHIKINGKMVK